jgi:hypothetical protein
VIDSAASVLPVWLTPLYNGVSHTGRTLGVKWENCYLDDA